MSTDLHLGQIVEVADKIKRASPGGNAQHTKRKKVSSALYQNIAIFATDTHTNRRIVMSRCIYCGREAHVLSPTAGGMVCKRCDPLRPRRRNAGLRAWYRGIDAADIVVIAAVIAVLAFLVFGGR